MNFVNILDSVDADTTLCGGIAVPNTMFNLVATIIKGIKIVVPILLIIWGMMDFAKAVVAKKEEDIKKYQKSFISRLISAALVFLVITIVQLSVNLLSGVEKESTTSGQTTGDIWTCSKKFIMGVSTDDTSSDDSDSSDNSSNNSEEE